MLRSAVERFWIPVLQRMRRGPAWVAKEPCIGHIPKADNLMSYYLPFAEFHILSFSRYIDLSLSLSRARARLYPIYIYLLIYSSLWHPETEVPHLSPYVHDLPLLLFFRRSMQHEISFPTFRLMYMTYLCYYFSGAACSTKYLKRAGLSLSDASSLSDVIDGAHKIFIVSLSPSLRVAHSLRKPSPASSPVAH